MAAVLQEPGTQRDDTDPNPAPAEGEQESPEARKKRYDDVIADAKRYLEFCIAADGDNHANGLDDLQFLAGDQWAPEARRQRELDGRPCLTINKLPTFLHQITNDQRQNVCSIHVAPVDSGADIDTAEVEQGMIRHIEYASNADIAYDTAVNSAAAIGFGYFRIVTEFESPDSFDQVCRFKRVRNAFTVYFDPASEEPDGSDARRCMITGKMPKDLFKTENPEATATQEGFNTGIGDKSNFNWLGSDFIRVAEFYRVEQTPAVLIKLSNDEVGYEEDLLELPPGVTIVAKRPSFKQRVMWYKLTALEVLDETEIKCDWIPVFPVYGDEIDLDGRVVRSGLIRAAKDPARMYNYWSPLSLDTPIPTPDGWSSIGNLREGDIVFSDTGAQTRVVGKSPVFIRHDCYRVTFGDGSHIDADAQHPWVVEVRGKRCAGGFNWTTQKLRTDELLPQQHCIKPAASLEGPEVSLPVDPYFLGAWLGDGTSQEPQITASHDDVEAMRHEISKRGLSVGPARVYGDKAPVFTVHGIRAELTALNVRGNKHIPFPYLRASVAQRLELLRGLMDTDGSVHMATDACMFTQADHAFAEQVRELIVSLGMRVGVTRRAARMHVAANGTVIAGTGSTQLAFTPPEGMCVFSLPRKAEIQTRSRARHPRRAQHKIVSVERIASVPVQCIAIDAPSHLFLAGKSMIPTHNTAATEEVALRTKTPFIGAEGQFEGYEDDWDQANVRSLPYLEYKPVTIDGTLAPAPQRQPMTDVPQGHTRMLLQANDDIKATTGLFDSSLGNRGNATSGIQERAQQRQGDLANFHYTDNRNRSVRQAGRCLISMIPHYYNTQRVVRIMGEDGKIDFAEINKPIPPEEQKPDEKTGAIRRILNDMTVGEYDVTVSAGPSYNTLRQEASESMIEMGGKWPKLMEVAGDKVIRAMDWPGAQEIADRLAKTIPPELRDDDEGEQQPVVQTPKGPIPVEQAGQMLVEMDQQIQMMGQELTEAKSGVEKAKIDAQAKIEVAEINAVSRGDVEELKGLVQLLIAQIPPPPVLGAEVAADTLKDDQEAGEIAEEPQQPAGDPRIDQILQMLAQQQQQPTAPARPKRAKIRAPSGAEYTIDLDDSEPGVLQ